MDLKGILMGSNNSTHILIEHNYKWSLFSGDVFAGY